MAKFDEVLVDRVVRGQPFHASELTDDDKHEVVRRLHARGHGKLIAMERLGLSPATVRRILSGDTSRGPGIHKASRRTRVLLRVDSRDDALRLARAIADVGGAGEITEAHPDFERIMADALAIIERLRDSQPSDS